MKKKSFLLILITFLSVFPLISPAQNVPPQLEQEEHTHGPVIIIDTDMGLDDAVTLALALQSPDVHLEAVVGCLGACSAEKCSVFLNRLLADFNRSDVMLYQPAGRQSTPLPPPFRSFVEQTLSAALPHAVADASHVFNSDVYISHHNVPAVVLALGPLTNIAAALEAEPAVKKNIDRIIIPGLGDPEQNWNLQYDRHAFEVVRQSQIELFFVSTQTVAAAKPHTWRTGPLDIGPKTSVGEGFFRRLLSSDPVRRHYTEKLASFGDELAFLAVVKPALFKAEQEKHLLVPIDQDDMVAGFTGLLSEGRQRKTRVVFAEEPLPPAVLNPEVRERMTRIIAKNGPDEWFAQLIMNELHDHLGAYSIIGVKMGLRAAELLNAPPHGMVVVSHVRPGPPISCLNDGIIVATGSSPGRALYSQGNIDPDHVKASFYYNGKNLTLTLKDEYRQQVQQKIQSLLQVTTTEDPAYWQGVRQLGLEIWENWHRRDLFDISPK